MSLRPFTGKPDLTKLDKSVHEAPIGMLFSPIILAALVILIFFFPNVLGSFLIMPAFTAVMPAMNEMEITISAWHGLFSPELWMTIGVIIVGLFMYATLKKWIGIYRFYPQVLTLK